MSHEFRFKFNSLTRTPTSHFSTTIPSTDFTDRTCSNFIVAIVEGRGNARGEVGMAAVNLEYPELLVYQFPDNNSYTRLMTKLCVLRPMEILMPHTLTRDSATSMVHQKIVSVYGRTIMPVERKIFNMENGLRDIIRLCCPSFSSVEMEVKQKYYGLASVAALISHLETSRDIKFTDGAVKVVCESAGETAIIDQTTVKNLELLDADKNGGSLYSFLNYTYTKNGARMLRASIIEPSIQLETIILRQDCINELSVNHELFENLIQVIPKFEVDFDSILANMAFRVKRQTNKVLDQQIDVILFLKHILNLVPGLCNILGSSSLPFFNTYFVLLSNERYDEMLYIINSKIREDCVYSKTTPNKRLQRCYATQDGIIDLLDITRKTMDENIENISDQVDILKQEVMVQDLELIYTSTRQYHLRFPRYTSAANDAEEQVIPPRFIRVSVQKHVVHCTTTEIECLNHRLEKCQDECISQTKL